MGWFYQCGRAILSQIPPPHHSHHVDDGTFLAESTGKAPECHGYRK